MMANIHNLLSLLIIYILFTATLPTIVFIKKKKSHYLPLSQGGHIVPGDQKSFVLPR